MSETEDRFGATDVEPTNEDDVESAGERSLVYHEDDVGGMESVHDDRTREVLINDNVVPDAGSLLADTVRYEPGVACPEHYHEGSKHFFYVLEGEGVIEIEGSTHELERGTIAWVGEGDRHRLYTREDQAGMLVFEFFSNADCETVWTDGPQCTWTPSESE